MTFQISPYRPPVTDAEALACLPLVAELIEYAEAADREMSEEGIGGRNMPDLAGWRDYFANRDTRRRTRRGVTPAEFKAIASLYMADDDADKILSVGEGGEDDLLRDWLDEQARQLGYDNWVIAYHQVET